MKILADTICCLRNNYLPLSSLLTIWLRMQADLTVGPSDSEDLFQLVSPCHRNPAPIYGDSFGSIPMTQSRTRGRTGRAAEGVR